MLCSSRQYSGDVDRRVFVFDGSAMRQEGASLPPSKSVCAQSLRRVSLGPCPREASAAK